MRRRWVALGLSAVGLAAVVSAGQAPEGANRVVSLRPAADQLAPAWSAPIEVARGPARAGDWRQNDSEFHYVDDPTVAVGLGGVVAVGWADQSRRDVFVQIYDRSGRAMLDSPVNVSRDAGVFSWLPRIALSPGDQTMVYVAWQELIFSGGSHGGDLFFARSADGGRTFDTPLNLSRSIAGDGKGRISAAIWDNGSLDIVAGPAGEIHVAWTEYEGALWYRRSGDRGGTFTEPELVAGDRTAPARAPSLAVGPDGTVHLAWSVREGGPPGIRVATSRDGGTAFEAPAIVGGSDGRADAPKLAVDREATVHLVYADAVDPTEPRSHIAYTRRGARAEAFDPPRAIPGTEDASAGFPSLDVDDEAGVYVLWERSPTIVGRALGLGFARSADAGRSFSSPSVIPATADVWLGVNGSRQGGLMRKLAVGDDGTIAVVNSSFREGAISRVRLIVGR
jgi:hypothetical protein